MSAPRRPARPDLSTVNELARQLGALLRELDLTEIEATVGEVRVRVERTRGVPVPLAAAPTAAASHAAPATAGMAVAETTLPNAVTVEAPMVGTFYRAPSPTAEPYTREGDLVKEGQILCIIEAMKLMNEIEAKVSGRIAKILVENGQPVEYGQPLFLIEPVR